MNYWFLRISLLGLSIVLFILTYSASETAYFIVGVLMALNAALLNPRGIKSAVHISPYYEAPPRKVHTDTGWIIFEGVYFWICLATGGFLFALIFQQDFTDFTLINTLIIFTIFLPATILKGNRK